MYKLLVVDDEEEVRQGLILKIEWDRYNFEIIGEAQNGREALDIIEDIVPDVIITDISMPILNGLGLSEAVKNDYPTIKTVILTGYDDFNYAQQAIKFGVEDYILKPVLPKDMEKLLSDLQNKLDREVERKENIARLKEHFNESLPIIREKYLSLIVEGNLSAEDIESKIDFFNFNLKGSCYVTAVAKIEDSGCEDKIFAGYDVELMRFAVMNIAKEIVDKHVVGEALFYKGGLVVIFNFKTAVTDGVCNTDILCRRVYSVLEEIRQNVEKHLKLTFTAGVGSVANCLFKLSDSYTAAVSALEYRLVMGDSKIIFIEDLEPKRKNIIAFDEHLERRLGYAIKFGTKNEVNEIVKDVFDNLSGTKAPFQEYQLYLVEVVAAISRICRDVGIDAADVLGLRTNLYVEMLEFSSFSEIRKWMEVICNKLLKYISDSRQKTTQVLLKKAQDYVLCNFGDEELSIQKVAEHLHISQSYLSMIFKKETGETFLKYLVGIRLNASIELLQGSCKTAEIAERVGYPDISYFSYFFKKNFGMSPREFRNKSAAKKG